MKLSALSEGILSLVILSNLQSGKLKVQQNEQLFEDGPFVNNKNWGRGRDALETESAIVVLSRHCNYCIAPKGHRRMTNFCRLPLKWQLT